MTNTALTVTALFALGACEPASAPAVPADAGPLPATLADTGFAGAKQTFTPQYPLWSDGAKKQRWIYLPGPIDGRDADAWQFPVGTKLWKQFSFGGRPVETRYMERTPAGWRFATYAWSDDGTTATLAPARGMTSTAEVAPGIYHVLPSETDCRACHDTASPVLGFSALQLSPDRDPNAPHAEPRGELELEALLASGRLRNYRGPARPRIAGDATQRAALGYLHGNCGGCHNTRGPIASVGMVLKTSVVDGSAPVIASTAGVASHFAPTRARIAAHAPEASVVVERMSSRNAVTQMPPLGTRVIDAEATRLVASWISRSDFQTHH